MMRAMTLFCTVLMGSILLVAQAPAAEGNNPQQTGATEHKPKQLVKVSSDDSGKDVTLSKNGKLVVNLPANPSTGYSWALSGDPSPLVLVTSDYQRGSGQPAVGAAGIQVLTFKATAPGTASLQLGYSRPWEENVPPVKAFTVTVHVK